MDIETVRKVARVARLKLSPQEEEQFSRDLEEVLQYFSLLDEAPQVETGGGSSTCNVLACAEALSFLGVRPEDVSWVSRVAGSAVLPGNTRIATGRLTPWVSSRNPERMAFKKAAATRYFALVTSP